MKNDINLLLRTKTDQTKKSKLSHLLRLTSVVSIAAVLLTSFILYILSRQLSLEPIKVRQNAVINNINFLKNKQAKLIVINAKLDDVSQIMTKRPRFDSDIQTILPKVPSGVASRSLTLGKQRLTFRVESNSLKNINDFINNFAQMAKSKSLIKDLTLGGIGLDPTSGNYSLSVEAEKL